MGGAAVFNPATLALTAWLRSYNNSPWSGTASAGTSGSNNANEGVNPPAIGATLNGFATADFDGTNDILALSGTIGTYYSTTAYSGWALFRPDAVDTNSATSYANDGILAAGPSAYWSLTLKSTGDAVMRHFDSAGREGTVTGVAIGGAWNLITWRFDGSTVRFRLNSGAYTDIVATTLNAAAPADAFTLGRSPPGGTTFLDGRIADFGLSNIDLGTTNLDNIKSYVNSRYALSL